jgi:hypothetical protein
VLRPLYLTEPEGATASVLLFSVLFLLFLFPANKGFSLSPISRSKIMKGFCRNKDIPHRAISSMLL